MFIGPRITRVFTSRWQALFWAAGVLFSAFWMAESDKIEHGGDKGVTDAVAAAAASNGVGASDSANDGAPAKSPWAPDAPASPATSQP